MTPELIINAACYVLQLDKIKLTEGDASIYRTKAEKKVVGVKYKDCRLIVIHLMRNRIIDNRAVLSKIDGKRVLIDADKPITYREIAYVFKKKQPQTAMASELRCKDLLTSDKKFKKKYDMVANILDGKTNIA